MRSDRTRGAPTEATIRPATTSSLKAVEDSLDISIAAEALLDADDDLRNQAGNNAAAGAERSSSVSETVSQSPSRHGPLHAAHAGGAAKGSLTEEQQEVVDELKKIDREVRAHEQAHLAAAGRFAKGGPTYSYQQGPDGKQYAVDGEVAIDTAPVAGDPEATLEKARIVRAAATAPAEPSAQDRAVAAAAAKLESQASQELRQQEDGKEPNGQPITEQRLEIGNQIVSAGQLLDLIG